jgi:hypothetical protein
MKDWNLWPALYIAITIVLVVIIAQIDFFPEEEKPVIGPEKRVVVTSYGEMEITSRLRGDMFQVLKDDKWEDVLIKGVNLGLSSPGHFPGEAAITYDQYSRWMQQISEMNANCIRVYTVHPPEFYRAFFEYNKDAEKPLYLFHGAWVDEGQLMKTMNAFASINVDIYYHEIEKIIDVVHGNADFSWSPGHAYGDYNWDISRFVIGYILGIEWDPTMVKSTNDNNLHVTDLDGSYFSTKDANPFEIWNARAMEHAAVYEAEKYGAQRPIAFSNWPTTDALSHPSGVYFTEDLVSLDPNNISTTRDFYPGQFASYHIYPYYPEFINYDLKYRDHLDPDGDKSSYGGYLNDLKSIHDMPVLVAEFGLSSSRGMSHRQINGMNHGGLTEDEQGEMNAKLFKTIVAEGYAGGILFSWHDEWFKKTWSTVKLANGDRTPYWQDAMTCEQAYGMLTFDPGSETSIVIDGHADDWDLMENVITIGIGSDPDRTEGYERHLSSISITSDMKYVYFRIDLEGTNEDFRWGDMEFMILLDTKSEQGQTEYTDHVPLDFGRGIDLIVHVSGWNNSRMLIDSYYDPFHYIWGQLEGEIEPQSYATSKNNGIFHPINYVLSREVTLWEQNKTYPFDYYEAGRLNWGISEPGDQDYDSNADIFGSTVANTIEIRVPWLMMNFRDPSRKEVLGDFQKNGLDAGEFIKGFRVGIISIDPGKTNSSQEVSNETEVIESFPGILDGKLSPDGFLFYEWDYWNDPEYHERLKPSYHAMKLEFGSYED